MQYPVTTTGRGRTVEEWKQRVDRPDNHWLDCLVGCAVAGSMLGAHLASEGEARPQRKKVVIREYLRRQLIAKLRAERVLKRRTAHWEAEQAKAMDGTGLTYT